VSFKTSSLFGVVLNDLCFKGKKHAQGKRGEGRLKPFEFIGVLTDWDG
jgi:hypothetical protein